MAPVNAPATCPNNSLSRSVSGRAAGDLDKRLVAPAAAAMNGAGDQRFARAAFAADQHGGPRVGHAVDHVEHSQHAVVMADDVLHAETQVELGLQCLVFFQHLVLVQRPLNGHQQFFVDQRLGEKVERAP